MENNIIKISLRIPKKVVNYVDEQRKKYAGKISRNTYIVDMISNEYNIKRDIK